MAALSTLRGYVRDEIGELTANRWTDAQLNSWLNRGVNYLINQFYERSCWDLLRKLARQAPDYTLTASTAQYSVYDVIVSNNFYGFISASWSDYNVQKITIEELHRATSGGEYSPSTTNPYILFWGADKTEQSIAFTGGGVDAETYDGEPYEDDTLTGATSASTAKVAKAVGTLGSGTWAAGDAAGTIYLYAKSAAFQSENLDLTRADGTTQADVMTIAADLTAIDHGKTPYFTLYPTPSAADTLEFWYLQKPTAMSAAADIHWLPEQDCDELLVLYGAARAYKADRNLDMHNILWGEFQQETQKIILKHSEPTAKPLPYQPVM